MHKFMEVKVKPSPSAKKTYSACNKKKQNKQRKQMNQQKMKRWQPEAAKEAAKQEAERLVFRDETTIDEPRSTRQSPSGEEEDAAIDVEVDPSFIKEKHQHVYFTNNTKHSEFADDVAAEESSTYIFPETHTHTTTTNTTISIEDHIPAAGEANLNPAEIGLLFGQEGVVSSKTIM